MIYGTLKTEMDKMLRYMLAILLAGSLMTADVWAVARKPKPMGGDKAKPADTTKLAPKGALSEPAYPESPLPADTSKGAKLTPTKFNDFLDKNKNGVDDRLEKCTTEKKKPSSTTTKSRPTSKTGETKKAASPTIKRTISKRAK